MITEIIFENQKMVKNGQKQKIWPKYEDTRLQGALKGLKWTRISKITIPRDSLTPKTPYNMYHLWFWIFFFFFRILTIRHIFFDPLGRKRISGSLVANRCVFGTLWPTKKTPQTKIPGGGEVHPRCTPVYKEMIL